MRPIVVTESRTYPVPADEAYRIVAPMPLPDLFVRGFLALPAVREVRGQTGPEWGTAPGHTRTLVMADGGTLREHLIAVDPPHGFSYELSEITGPMKPLVTQVGGEWRFDADGNGTRITWSWRLEPKSVVTAPVLWLVGLMWHGFARLAFDRIAERLHRDAD
jgi:hypothetical protein